VNPDHVHLFVGFRPNLSVSHVTQLFKGTSAYRLFREFPWLRKVFQKGHLWSEGKFYRSVGNTTADVVKHYIACSQGDWSKVFKVPEFSDFEPDVEQLTLTDWIV
jgi:putative transposase